MAKKGFLDGYKTYDTSKGFGNSNSWKKAFEERMSKEEAISIIDSSSETPFDILGIPSNSSNFEIKKAFRKRILEWHPDRNLHRIQEAEEMTKKIIAAYTILKK